MKNNKWVRIKIMPPENTAVDIFMNFGDGNFFKLTGHHEQGVWFSYDLYENKFRIIRNQKAITHWKNVGELPIKNNNNENIHPPAITSNVKEGELIIGRNNETLN